MSLTPDVQLKLLKEPWKPPHDFVFPVSIEGKRVRRFNASWLGQFPWLAYSPGMEGAYCKHCVLFANRHPSCGAIGALVIAPLKRYKDALVNFRDHQKAAYHQEALENSREFLSL